MLAKLLSHLPRYFDADSAPVLALRVQHSLIAKWVVADRTLTVTGSSGQAIGTYDLRQFTILTLKAALEAAACTVTLLDGVSHFPADMIVDGSGSQAESNGDHLYIYSAPLWALMDALALGCEDANTAIDAAMLEAYLHSASGEWLDLWGSKFGVVRQSRWRSQSFTWSTTLTWRTANRRWGIGQEPSSDSEYWPMIVRDTIRPRSNALGVEQAVSEDIGVYCRVREPWQDVARFDDGTQCDDRWHLYDANFWTWGVLQPIWYNHDRLSDVARALTIINRTRAAGALLVHAGETPPPCAIILHGGAGVSVAAHSES